MSDKSSKLLSGCKDTIAGKCAFSLFQFTHASSGYSGLLPVFFACKGTIHREGGLGNRGGSREIKTLTGKWRTEEIEEAE